ncbi:MAG TPA: hypothetical protein VHV47_02700, partial [Opitutaceae bacterium]|nr:hypothetical protein [Opitutaceae bacterium]
TEIDSTLAPGFQAAGVPLNNDQSQALVQAMNAVRNPQVNAAARDPSFREIDPQTGLSPSDQGVINRASQGLSMEQVAILKQEFSDGNQVHALIGSGRLTMQGIGFSSSGR